MQVEFWCREKCQQQGMALKKASVIPHPYTYLPASAETWFDKDGSVVLWYDLESGKLLPPCFGYGEEAQEMVDEWQKKQREWETQDAEHSS